MKLALSVQKLTGDVTLLEYENYLKDLRDCNLEIDEIHYEIGHKKGRVHFHALCTYSGKVKPRSKKIFRPGWNVVLEEVHGQAGWERYIRKEIHEEDEVRMSIDSVFWDGFETYKKTYCCLFPEVCHRYCCMDIRNLCSNLSE